MFQILRKFHTEEMSTVKAERPAPSAQRHTTGALLNEKRVPVFFSLKENVEVEVETVARPSATLEHHSRLARSAPPLVMFQILRKFHTEEMSTVKAERPAPSATLEHHSRTAECYYELSTFFLVGKMLSPNVGAPRRM